MKYEGTVYRPPSEARSLIIQVTIGCSHNKCTFCSMYKDKKFRIRKIDEVFEDLKTARKAYKNVNRIFLADGNALVLKTEKLKQILHKINELFPECQRVGIYSAPKDILRKSLEELIELHRLGLKIAYLGVESGSPNILNFIKKGVTPKDMIEAGKKIIASGIKLSVTLISGLGGRQNWKEHAIESAKVINEIDPHYLALLTLLVHPNTELYRQIQNGEFTLLTPNEVMLETKELIKNLNVTNCIFRSNHASNYLPLAGTLPKDKNLLLKTLNNAVNEKYDYRDELFRSL
ncbi:radical SAM protein [Caldisalinibacter kiritimatiensis]|uniref:Oxygen-independent coproporphyrinogen III oxidase, Fe-S oxidoreductase n=1 Tax=Caldisalinibacter kiritimatiensis TaxID=1304284 RepID=R1ATY1_9FIRM|nr:radical SAM protein [Caldisalinibacter kiritimatiensis]EOD00593.1 Oxygen-independent coproporphyrinogen III oxidase, Fe-S oxidoreductase [Caldisalinibacter kiritimatiensis]